jgi:hypothetical protein
LAECEAHDGEQVEVVGTYKVWDPLPVRGPQQPPAQQVVVMFGSEEGPYLGAWGHGDHRRPLEEIERLADRSVRVVGTFLRTMPPHPTDPPTAASVSGPCIHPVESIAPA